MTVEIKQLIVRAVVEAGPDTRAGAARPEPRVDPQLGPLDRDALVAACVREVLRELNRAKER